MALSQVIKQLAMEAIENSAPTEIVFGKVTQVNPVEIYVDANFILKEEFGQLKLSRAVTDYETEITPLAWETENKSGGSNYDSFASHNHSINGRKRVIIHNSLVIDDTVILLRMQGGQTYLVLDKIGVGGSGSGGSADGGTYEFYDGSYVMTSSSSNQTMNTKNKILLDDVTIESMPRTEVENDGGGTTIIIG